MSNTLSSKRHCASLASSTGEDNSKAKDSKASGSVSEIPAVLKRKSTSQPSISLKSKTLLLQWIAQPKNSNPRKEGEADQPAPINEVTPGLGSR